MSDRLRKNLWFAYFVALLVWTLQAYALLGRLQISGELFAFEKDGHPYISDFTNVYNASVLCKTAATEKIKIYDAQVQAASADRLTAPVKAEQPFYLQMPPFFFSTVRPLAEFSMFHAWLLWCGLAVVALVVALWYFVRPIFVDNFSRLFAIVATIGSFPEWEGVRSGNPSMWLAPGVVLMWLLLRRHPAYAALCATVCLYKFQYLPLVGMAGLFVGRMRFVAVLAAITIALAAFACYTLGVENVLAFPSALAGAEVSSKVSGVAAVEMQNFRGQLCLLTNSDGSFVHIATLLILFVAVVGVSIMWWRLVKEAQGLNLSSTVVLDYKFKICASITTLLLLICSPHTHKHDFILVVVPAVWLWQTVACNEALPKALRLATRILIVAFPGVSWIFFMLEFLFHMVKIQPFFFWALSLCVIACLALRLKIATAEEHS